MLPNTLGPELLMPLLFTAFAVGHEFITNTEIPWHIQGFLYAGLIAVFLKVKNHSSFLVLLPILAFHTLIGMGTVEKKSANIE